MSIRDIALIGTYLGERFGGQIWLDDVSGKGPEERDRAFNTRALCALVLEEGSTPPVGPIESFIIDGYDDNGIDAIYADSTTKLLTIVQSKFVKPEAGVANDDVAPLVKGVRDILDGRFDRFNSRLRALEPSIAKLLEDFDLKVIVRLVSTSQHPMGRHQDDLISDFIKEVNEGNGDFVTFEYSGLEAIKSLIKRAKEPKPIVLTPLVSQFGQQTQPVKVVYGQVAASDIAQWFQEFGKGLFAKNIRFFKHDSEVNAQIQIGLSTEPDNFLIFNNGLTVVCDSIRKKPAGGNLPDAGVFEVQNASIVNGAQTVGSIAAVDKTNPESLKRARVLVRFISTEDARAGLSQRITRATNTQNRVENRDFVALDPKQTLLQKDLLYLGYEYVFKSGDTASDPTKAISLDDATIALACSKRDPSLAVLAKSGIGKLWADIDRAPYKDVFPADLPAQEIVDAVNIQRSVDSKLKSIQADNKGNRKRLVAIHGNRLILHLVFGLRRRSEFRAVSIEDLASKCVDEAFRLMEQDYLGNYPASIFKSPEKCKDIVDQVSKILIANYSK